MKLQYVKSLNRKDYHLIRADDHILTHSSRASKNHRTNNDRLSQLKSLLNQLVNRTGAAGGLLVILKFNNRRSIQVGEVHPELQLTPAEERLLKLGTPFMKERTYIHPLFIQQQLAGIICINTNKETWKTLCEDLVHAYALLVAQNIEIQDRKESFSEHVESLQSKKRELEKIQQYNQNLLSITTHDLSSPLNAVSGYLEMIEECLANDESKQKLHEYYRHIQMGVNDVSDMLKQLNEIIRLKEGCLTLHSIRIDANWVINDVCELLKAPARKKNIELRFLPNIKRAFIEVDVVKFKRIIYNLVSNAIKYTGEHQYICVDLNICDDVVEVQVKDEGKGISEDKIESIFEPFVKLNSGREDIFSHGLGLYIVSYFVELMGGEIAVESKSGKGSTFTVTMPQVTAPAYQNKSA